jgi:hypothetical protein
VRSRRGDRNDAPPSDEEVPLTGGRNWRADVGLVRIGDTVRRATGPHSELFMACFGAFVLAHETEINAAAGNRVVVLLAPFSRGSSLRA